MNDRILSLLGICKRAGKLITGSDIGGMGSKVHTEKNGDILSWLIEKPHGEVIKIDINQKESNKY